MKVRVTWTETIEQTADVEIGDVDDVEEHFESGVMDSVLADVEDADEYAVVERDVLSWEEIS